MVAGFVVLLALMLNSEQPVLQFAAIAVLGTFVLWSFLRRGNPVAWLSLLGLLALAAYAVYSSPAQRDVHADFRPDTAAGVGSADHADFHRHASR